MSCYFPLITIMTYTNINDLLCDEDLEPELKYEALKQYETVFHEKFKINKYIDNSITDEKYYSIINSALQSAEAYISSMKQLYKEINIKK